MYFITNEILILLRSEILEKFILRSIIVCRVMIILDQFVFRRYILISCKSNRQQPALHQCLSMRRIISLYQILKDLITLNSFADFKKDYQKNFHLMIE